LATLGGERPLSYNLSEVQVVTLREEFLRLLREDAEFRRGVVHLLLADAELREEIRREVLTRDLLNLPEQVEANFARAFQLITDLTRQVQENSRQIQENSRQIAENSRQIAELTERMERVEAQISKLTESLGRLEERWGLVHEDIARELLPEFLHRAGATVRRVVSVVFNGEADVVLEVEKDQRSWTLAVEVKGRVVGRRPFEQARLRVEDPKFQAWLRREGFPSPVYPVVFGIVVYTGAEVWAERLGVGLYDARRGEILPPTQEAAP
jgi:hypothetical protein